MRHGLLNDSHVPQGLQHAAASAGFCCASRQQVSAILLLEPSRWIYRVIMEASRGHNDASTERWHAAVQGSYA